MTPGDRRATADRHSETVRQLVHIAFGAGALLLRYLYWWQAIVFATAALLFNLYLLRRVTGSRLTRPGERDLAMPAGLVLCPAAVLLLLLMLPSRPDIVAAAWGILAAGDGAATLAGVRYGNRKWAWNRRKSMAGSLALFVAGSVAGVFLAWWCRPVVIPPPYWWFSIGMPVLAALAAAAVETVPIRLDDNLSVPLTAAAVLWAGSLVNQDLAVAAIAAAPGALLVAVPSTAAAAWAGYAARTVSLSGAVAGGVIGTVIFVCTGWQGWLLLLAAFLCAAVTSRLGLQRKTLLGIAEPRGGRRGAGSAIANTGIATAAAVLSATSYAPVACLIAFSAALTAGASDTVASEIGKAWGRRTYAIVPWRPVPPGTSGAVSLEGTAAGLVGAAALAAIAIALGLAPATALMAIVLGATAGSLAESLLSAAFEGAGILNSEALNLINTAVAAFVAVALS